MRRIFLTLFSALLLATPAAAAKLKVVATFSILGDMVENVAGDMADVSVLVGPDGDAHVFEPTAADARSIGAAQLVFSTVSPFEPWIGKLVRSTDSRTKLRFVLKHAGRHDHETDPHAWQDPGAAVVMVRNITAALIAADAPNAAFYRSRSDAYVSKIDATDKALEIAFAKIPKRKRRVITSHDGFSYLGSAYDIEFIAPLGVSTEEQPSAKGVARLITQIKREKIKAVFVENISDPRLIEQIARETGVKIGGKLYSDALSTKAGPAPTYIAMMRHNAKLLTAAMAKGS